MGILKVKDWKSKSSHQFKIILIGRPSNLIIKAQRISDGKLFELDHCVQKRGIFVANKFKEIHIFINKFMPDNVHVELYIGVNGIRYHSHDVEINNMEGMAAFIADTMATKLVDS